VGEQKVKIKRKDESPRFHDYFFDLLLHQPLGQHVQFTGGSAELAALKLILTPRQTTKGDRLSHFCQ
jgi:hypothetical protein